MKQNPKSYLLLILLLMFSMALAMGCGDDDDDDDGGDGPTEDDDDAVDDDDSTDDDDDDSTETTVEQFCEKVEACEDADAYVVEGACEASAAQMEQETLDCALEESCSNFVGCVENTDDRWLYDPIKLTPFVYVASLDFGGWSELGSGNKITPYEQMVLAYQYNDQEECDIKGGSIWGQLDDGAWEKLRTISPNAPCKQVGYDSTEAFEIDGSALDEGTHTTNVVFVDEGGQQSQVRSYTFKIEQYAGGVGSTVPELFDETFYLPGINQPAMKYIGLEDIYFDQFAGKILMMNASAVWCPYCGDEADELMEIYNLYNDAKEVGVEFIILMIENATGGEPDVDDLLNWADRDEPYEDITFPIVIDYPGSFVGDYFLNNGVPFSMIIDAEGVVRYKIHGYASSIGSDFEEIIDALIEEAETK